MKAVPDKNGAPRNVWQQVGRYTTLAFLLPCCVFVGYLLGWGLDKYFGTHWIYIPGLLIGIAAGFVELIREVSKDA
ncbi:MAG: AtpZ/AtpI family protein [Bryobacterales bacterium]|nr:AtpZ/AtpI family protein [Bryobacterales bacterium]